jgi:carbonic anhydrase/acetyltransferase-like protein (isoleucine patch superfamily)
MNPFVGSGAVIREGVRVGRRCVIGMGALGRSTTFPDGSIFYGNSAAWGVR